jgi:hypothetical protein
MTRARTCTWSRPTANEHDPNPTNDEYLRVIQVVFPIVDALFSDRFELYVDPTQN